MPTHWVSSYVQSFRKLCGMHSLSESLVRHPEQFFFGTRRGGDADQFIHLFSNRHPATKMKIAKCGKNSSSRRSPAVIM